MDNLPNQTYSLSSCGCKTTQETSGCKVIIERVPVEKRSYPGFLVFLQSCCNKWVVYHNDFEFCNLHLDLAAQFGEDQLPPFPDTSKELPQKYLQGLLDHPTLWRRDTVMNFLEGTMDDTLRALSRMYSTLKKHWQCDNDKVNLLEEKLNHRLDTETYAEHSNSRVIKPNKMRLSGESILTQQRIKEAGIKANKKTITHPPSSIFANKKAVTHPPSSIFANKKAVTHPPSSIFFVPRDFGERGDGRASLISTTPKSPIKSVHRRSVTMPLQRMSKPDHTKNRRLSLSYQSSLKLQISNNTTPFDSYSNTPRDSYDESVTSQVLTTKSRLSGQSPQVLQQYKKEKGIKTNKKSIFLMPRQSNERNDGRQSPISNGIIKSVKVRSTTLPLQRMNKPVHSKTRRRSLCNKLENITPRDSYCSTPRDSYDEYSTNQSNSNLPRFVKQNSNKDITIKSNKKPIVHPPSSIFFVPQQVNERNDIRPDVIKSAKGRSMQLPLQRMSKPVHTRGRRLTASNHSASKSQPTPINSYSNTTRDCYNNISNPSVFTTDVTAGTVTSERTPPTNLKEKKDRLKDIAHSEIHADDLLVNEKIGELVELVQPNSESEKKYQMTFQLIKMHIKQCLGAEVFCSGPCAVKTYLPNSTLDVCAFFTSGHNARFVHRLVSQLCLAASECQIKGVTKVTFVAGDKKAIHCHVGDIDVAISQNQVDMLASLALLEEMDIRVGQDHLFKRTLLLTKLWAVHEAHIFGKKEGLMSENCLRALLMYIFNAYKTEIQTPLGGLLAMLRYYSNFNWDQHGVTIHGPILLNALPQMTYVSGSPCSWPTGVEPIITKVQLVTYQPKTQAFNAVPQWFRCSFLNVVNSSDPLENLGISITKPNVAFIRNSFSKGLQLLRTGLSDYAIHCESPTARLYMRGSVDDSETGGNGVGCLVSKKNSSSDRRMRLASDMVRRLFKNSFVHYADRAHRMASPNVGRRWTWPNKQPEEQEKESEPDILSGDLQGIMSSLEQAQRFQMPVISEETLVKMVEVLLVEHGSMPVGKVGSLLHNLTQNHSLPAMLKQQFGGLKCLLMRHPEKFVMGMDHPYNPCVDLASFASSHDEKSTEEKKKEGKLFIQRKSWKPRLLADPASSQTTTTTAVATTNTSKQDSKVNAPQKKNSEAETKEKKKSKLNTSGVSTKQGSTINSQSTSNRYFNRKTYSLPQSRRNKQVFRPRRLRFPTDDKPPNGRGRPTTNFQTSRRRITLPKAKSGVN